MTTGGDGQGFAAGLLFALAVDRLASAYWLDPQLRGSASLTTGLILLGGCAIVLARSVGHHR